MVTRLDHHPRHCFRCVWRLFPGRVNWRRKTLPQNKLHFMLQPWRKEVWGKSYCFLATCCYLLFVSASTLIHTWWTYCCFNPLVTIQTHLSQSQKADREQMSLSPWIIMELLEHLILSGYHIFNLSNVNPVIVWPPRLDCVLKSTKFPFNTYFVLSAIFL